jgi:hypothetical protein
MEINKQKRVHAYVLISITVLATSDVWFAS